MSNNNYDLIYITLDGKINIIKKDIWQTQNKFDGINSSIITLENNIFKVSKITQLNTGYFLYLDDNCNVYKLEPNFTNPTLVSNNKFYGITQLSNYKILLTSKDGKLYTVDDINNFDSTTNLFVDDGLLYSSVKQTFDGYVVAIDGTQCGNAWRFDLFKNQLLNKTKLNLDEKITNRTTLFLPDQTALLNLNCDPRYTNSIIKYDFSDKTFESSNDSRCYDGQKYELLNKKCYKLCPSGYESYNNDILNCWSKCKSDQIDTGLLCIDKCKSGYNNDLGVCSFDQILTYDRGSGEIPDYSCPDEYDLVGLKCIKKPPDGYKIIPGDFTTYWLKDPISYLKKSTKSNQDNSNCDGLDTKKIGIGTCSGWDKCNRSPPFSELRLLEC